MPRCRIFGSKGIYIWHMDSYWKTYIQKENFYQLIDNFFFFFFVYTASASLKLEIYYFRPIILSIVPLFGLYAHSLVIESSKKNEHLKYGISLQSNYQILGNMLPGFLVGKFLSLSQYHKRNISLKKKSFEDFTFIIIYLMWSRKRRTEMNSNGTILSVVHVGCGDTAEKEWALMYLRARFEYLSFPLSEGLWVRYFISWNLNFSTEYLRSHIYRKL